MTPSRLLASLGLIAFTVSPVSAADLHAYVGAGLRQPVTAIAEAFEKETGNKVELEFGGSGQLLARFKESGAGDLFIPGSLFYADKLEKEGAVASRRIVVKHTPVLAVAKDKAADIKSFADLAKPGVKIGIGDPKAMALGRSAQDILKASGLGDKIEPNITVRAATVKQLELYLFDGDVDAAIVSASGVAMNMDKVSVISIPDDWYEAELVPVVVLATSRDRDAAEALAERLGSPEGLAVWKRFGFQPVD
ncbi:molybdate transport system substrate-binding protein [Breoghania corrubedonensis]|uniref:Molybdate transport system substrate-binding protein n=1 Tax=Breoghania corrubedonensis TaxID=665038 RepID=A0A2T5V6W1_9HYPH|nr:molybdate ABC transporter substrate-binding protein [Breoghania corrubedonensis]PTW59480.1 molybdate transport system substrate-binding protein [Breoghania corrubedonensis]